MQKEQEKFLLFRVWKHRDAAAYGELYNAYAPRIYRYLAFKLPSQKDAEELTSEVFLRAWEYLQNTTIDHFSAFLFRLARNTAADFYRKRPSELPIEESKVTLTDKRPRPDEEHDQNHSLELLQKHLKKLKEEYRDVIVMRYLDEMSYAEIALALDKTENTTRVLLHRALKALRTHFDT